MCLEWSAIENDLSGRLGVRRGFGRGVLVTGTDSPAGLKVRDACCKEVKSYQ